MTTVSWIDRRTGVRKFGSLLYWDNDFVAICIPHGLPRVANSRVRVHKSNLTYEMG